MMMFFSPSMGETKRGCILKRDVKPYWTDPLTLILSHDGERKPNPAGKTQDG
jgi:hypothetical protein